MTSTPSSVTSVHPQSTITSLAALRAAHGGLLRRHRLLGDAGELLAEVEAFIRAGRAAGAYIENEQDRWAAHGLLDYWTTTLYRAGHEPPDSTLAEFDASLAPELDEGLCPYRGLDAFHETDHPYFFGRQQLIEEWVEHLKTKRLLAVVGSSGSGKSSLVRGGLLPVLKAGALPGSEEWRYYPPVVSGSDPIAALARLIQPAGTDTWAWTAEAAQSLRQDRGYLARVIGDEGSTPVVLVVDQLEELFTLCGDEQARQAFVDSLLTLIHGSEARHTLILTLRTDFESQVARLPTLHALFEQARVGVTALNSLELRAAIEKPAELVGLKFEEGVVDDLIKEILGEPTGLPLLQFTLLKLWENRERDRITRKAYQRLGGARLALARTADAFYENLIPEDQIATKRVLLWMARPTEGLEVTSNRIRRESLYQKGEAPDRVDRVVESLVQTRLVRLTKGDTPADDQVEVAHEALVRNWPRFVEWLDEERMAMRRRLRLTAAAEHWRTSGDDPDALLRGSQLDEALRYEDLNELEAEFVQLSLAVVEEAEREKEAARQHALEQALALTEEQHRRAEAESERAELERERAEQQATASERLRRLVLISAAWLAVTIVPLGIAIQVGYTPALWIALGSLLALMLLVLVVATTALAGTGAGSVPTAGSGSGVAPAWRRARPIWVVAALSIATWGLYPIYWLFATWRELKAERSDPSMRPFWHAVAALVPFYQFFTVHAHARAIRDLADSSGVRTSLTPTTWVLLWVVFGSFSVINIALSWLLIMGSTLAGLLFALVGFAVLIWLLKSAQSALNAVWRALPGGAHASTAHPSEIAILLIAMFLPVAVGVYASLYSTDRRIAEAAVLWMQADSFALDGDAARAEAGFTEAVQVASKTSDFAVNNSICWWGSLDGFATSVMPACERAVALAPGNAECRDSRGLARALTGDAAGAIDDFTAFVEWSNRPTTLSRDREKGLKRVAWIAELKEGRNPFDAETRSMLRYE